MNSNKGQVQRAGLLYAIASGLAPFAYLYVPGALVVETDALATAERVRASEYLLRAGIGAELYSVTILLFAALALYRLFKPVDAKSSTLMLAMMLVSVPISYVGVLFYIAPLVLLKNTAIAAVLDPGQAAALSMLFMRLHNYGLLVNQIFWGAWLFPMGLLVMRSGFMPRWLAWPLWIAGGGYVLNSLGGLFLPASLRWLTSSLQTLGVGEAIFMFYVLIWGVRRHALDRVSVALVLSSSVIGIAGLVSLMTRRIDATQYAAFVAACLVITAAIALRWRWSDRMEGGATTRTAAVAA